ncbi:DNA primase [Chishuiella changwenlii]|uniref:DNA primase n=1 Tax=Chishuiella changwenlii TaxID=1434701 RepID=A0A1M7BQN0_9FLAO|nr:DNA primase [Chishuiella changwenlii]GGF03269.1 DNA primase [Chishuiella changwenlii]SHL57176.1 DNA primase [Chishuiella changwenlii]
MISQRTIDIIFETARVEEVVGDFVNLKRAGSSLKGLSPFGNEKTPSFVVSPAKQIWKDFSSGRGGNVVTFLMEVEQFTYPEALRWLAKRYNIEIEEDVEYNFEQQQEEKERESLYILTDFAKKYFTNQLHNSEEGNLIGLSYFRERGFTKEIIDKFELGYSPKQWDAFAEHALKSGYSKELIEEAGLATFKEDDKKYDKFRERVIFPIYSFSGRTLGFGGRILRNDVKAAKYLNSPENKIYHKSKTLYGLFQAKQQIIKADQCFLVEGYTDVLALHQAGLQNTVASSGTALTNEQIRLIKRLTENITVMYDGDNAGIKASFRGIDMILEQEMNVKVLLLPEGEDPDSFAKKHSSSEIENYIKENATDFIRFKVNVLLEEANNDPIKKAELIREIVKSISLIPNIIKQEVYIAETSKIMGIREEVLFKELAQLQKSGNKSSESNSHITDKARQKQPNISIVTGNKEVINVQQTVETEIIKLIMQNGDLEVELKNENNELYKTTVNEEIISQFDENELKLSNPLYQLILEDVKNGLEKDELRTGIFFSRSINPEVVNLASEMMIEKYNLSENWTTKQGIHIKKKEEFVHKDLFDVLLRFKIIYIDNFIKDLMNKTKNTELPPEEIRQALQQIIHFTGLKNILNEHLNRVI